MKLAILNILESISLNSEIREVLEEILNNPSDPCSADDNGRHIKFELLDVEYKHNKHPDTFYIPTHEEKDLIVHGMWVKIIADWMNYEDPDERFWVVITEEFVDEKGERCFYGVSLNDTQILKYGTKLGPIRLRNICHIDFEEFEQRNSTLTNVYC